tara:strand:- start:43 stop:234 length:192 start_codon:yes stop_codon:yes gene_type:complete
MLRFLSLAFVLGGLVTAADAQVDGERVSAELVSNGSFIKHFGELDPFTIVPTLRIGLYKLINK